MPDAPLATRRLIPFAALSASYFAHIGFFNPYLPLWLKEMGYGIFAISVLTSVQAATRLFAPYGWGVLSDRTGERVKLMRLCAMVALTMTAGLWFELGFTGLLLVFLVLFTHTSAMMPMSEAAMAHWASQQGGFDTRLYGRVRLWGSIGFLVTVFVAGSWFESHGMKHFPAWTSMTLLAVALSAWFLPDVKDAANGSASSKGVGPIVRNPVVAWFFASLFFHVLAHIGVYVYFSLYLDAQGYSKTAIGLMWVVSVVVEIAWFFTQSRWLPRFSSAGWLVVCSAAMAVRMGLTAWGASTAWMLVTAQLLHALTFAAHHAICVAMVAEYFPGRLRGRGQALFTVIGYGLTGVLGSLGGGFLIEIYGLSAVYWASLAIALIAMACAFKVWNLRRRAPELT